MIAASLFIHRIIGRSTLLNFLSNGVRRATQRNATQQVYADIVATTGCGHSRRQARQSMTHALDTAWLGVGSAILSR